MSVSTDYRREHVALGQRLLAGGALLLLLHAGAAPARADSWQLRAPVPGARAAHSAVWTGRELVVWGGGIDGSFLNTGARYLPAIDTWRTTSPYGAPSPRWFHASVWTGSEMIIWGGRPNFDVNGNFNDGARYNPSTDTWSPMSGYGAPIVRSQCAAVWTGEEMVVWGGATEGGVPLSDGAAYNPATDEWRPINSASGLASRMEPTAVWTGSEMIVFGGVDTTQPGWLSYGDGARYNPFTDSWTPLPAAGAPSSRTAHTAVWTGERMIVWGGRDVPSYSLLNDGAIYNPGSDTWTGFSPYNAPQARMLHAAVWTGTEMIVWGGQADAAGTLLNTGARYNPATGTWTALTQDNAPGQRMFWRPDLGIWTGRGMLVCAGSDYPASLDSTYLYTLADPPCPPVIREQPQSLTAIVGESVTLAVGAEDCAASLNRSVTQISTDPEPHEFVFETGARAGELEFVYRFFNMPDSLRVYYDGQRIFDRVLSGEGTVRVPFGPGNARSVRIVVNEESAAQPGSAWVYTVIYRPLPLHYQWRKDGATLAGETTATLHLSSAALADAGGYSVVVANDNSAVVSDVATLTVLPPRSTNCVPPGLVAWWRGDGDATDVTGAHDGTLLFGTAFSPGVAGRAFSFDLSRARVSIPDDDAFKLTDSLSFEGWINVASYAPGIIFIRGDNRPGLDPYHMAVDASGQFHWGIVTADNQYVGVMSPGILSTGVWTHVAAVLDGATGNLGLYVNGSRVNQTNTSLRPLRDLDPNSEPTLGIGNHGGTLHHFPFHGSVDEWALYSRALSAGEIMAIFQAGGAGKCFETNPTQPAVVFDVSSDFSPTSNPTGVWSYGYAATLGGPFHLLTFAKSYAANNGVPISAWQVTDALSPSVNRVMGDGVAISEGGAFTAPSGTVYVWPGNDGSPGVFGIIRFTVPAGGIGVYRIDSAARSNFDGPVSGDSDFHVLRNGQEVFGQFLAPNSATVYSNTLTLATGDSIDFAVGRGVDGSPDHSSLKVQAAITLVTNAPPQPPIQVFDLSGDFSLATNPNGPWSYGRLIGSITGSFFSLLDTSGRVWRGERRAHRHLAVEQRQALGGEGARPRHGGFNSLQRAAGHGLLRP